jgi:hypothetical protein
MAETVPQSYATHRRWVPLYHFVLAALVLVLLGWQIWELIRDPSVGAVRDLLLLVAVALSFYYLRTFPLVAQDRIIRLEERLRLERLLPEDLRGRIEELTPGQLIGLRFASDGEVAELCRWILQEHVTEREAIKKRVKSWRPDHLRV